MPVTKMSFQNPGPSQQFNSHGNDIFSCNYIGYCQQISLRILSEFKQIN